MDAGQELAADGAHGNAVGLASPDLALEVLLQVGIEAAGGGGGQPEGAAEVGGVPLGELGLSAGELARGVNGRSIPA